VSEKKITTLIIAILLAVLMATGWIGFVEKRVKEKEAETLTTGCTYTRCQPQQISSQHF